MRFRLLQTNPLAGLLVFLLLAWLGLGTLVGINYITDRTGAYEGTVQEIRSAWYDPLTLEFLAIEHLVIETPDGQIIDKLIGMEDRAFFRVGVGDYVVKEHGFHAYAHPVGKPSVQELLAAGAAAVEAVGGPSGSGR